jgi:hypothetical protein
MWACTGWHFLSHPLFPTFEGYSLPQALKILRQSMCPATEVSLIWSASHARILHSSCMQSRHLDPKWHLHPTRCVFADLYLALCMQRRQLHNEKMYREDWKCRPVQALRLTAPLISS